MPRRELNLQKKIVDAIIKLGGVARVRAQTPYTTVGDPDVYGVYRGRHFEIEVKEENEIPTRVQNKRMQEWAKAHAIVFVARSVEGAITKLKEIAHREGCV